MKKTIQLALFFLLLQGAHHHLYAQDYERDERLIAKYISNALDYVVWPSYYQYGDFGIGVYQSSKATNYLRMHTAGKAYLDQSILVRHYTNLDAMAQAPDLKMVYLPYNTSGLLDSLHKKLDPKPVLIITNQDQPQEAYMMNIKINDKGQVVVDIHEELILRNQLTISDKIYAIAREQSKQ